MQGGKYICPILLIIVFLCGCEPYEVDDIDLGPAPTGSFTYEILPNNPNLVRFVSQTDNAFLIGWDFGNGVSSNQAVDTANFLFAGEYVVTMTAAGRGGSASSMQTIVIAQDDANACSNETLLSLVGGCTTEASKGWTFSFDSGAISVGPEPGSSEWFISAAGGLVPEQYDDTFVFKIDENTFEYENNVLTVNPWEGYEAQEYIPPTDAVWDLSFGTGMDGKDQIILTEGSFMGVRDSGPIYDIVEMTDESLVLSSPIIEDVGFFTLHFKAAN